MEALQKVFEYIDQEKIDRILCLGDVVGYGPNPNECVEIIRERCDVVLMGNHDYAAIGLANIEYFNDYAKASVFWTTSELTKENQKFLADLAFSYEEDNFMLVHASPSQPAHWHYILSPDMADLEMDYFNQPICFIGHSHVPVIYARNGIHITTPLKLETKAQKYIINVGSVGQPRDGEPKTCFVVYDTETEVVEHVRMFYPVNTTYEKIVKSGLPVFLAERLLKGH